MSKLAQRQKIRYRIRKKVTGTSERPRLTVFRSNKNISVQVVDDTAGKTLCSVSSLGLAEAAGKNNVEVSELIGKMIAEKASASGIKNVVFDRNGFLYKGQRIKALADAAREGGLLF